MFKPSQIPFQPSRRHFAMGLCLPTLAALQSCAQLGGILPGIACVPRNALETPAPLYFQNFGK